MNDSASRGDATPGGPPPVAAVNLLELEPGTRVRLAGGATGEVVLNPKDGMWLHVRYLTSPADPSLAGTEAMLFADDVLGVL